MNILAAILCARVIPPSEGGISLLQIMDAAQMAVPFPSAMGFAYYFVVEVAPHEAGNRAQVHVEVVDPDGRVIAREKRDEIWQGESLVSGRENVVIISNNVEVEFHEPGPHDVRLVIDGKVVAGRSLAIYGPA